MRAQRSTTMANLAVGFAFVVCIITSKTTQAFAPIHSFNHKLTTGSTGNTDKITYVKEIYSSKIEEETKTATDNNNIFTNFLSSITSQSNKITTPVESEEDRLRRLKAEEIARLEELEIQRQDQVRVDSLPYLFIFALQLLPLIGTDRIEGIIYFFGVAVTTVYVGGRQVTLQESEKVSSKNALFAPIGASVSIGFLYVLLKMGIDPTTLYAFAISLFGALAISDVGVPILRNILPFEGFATAKVEAPQWLTNALIDEKDGDVLEQDQKLPLDGLITLGLGLSCTAAYWAPFAMEQKFILSNFIAWALAMTSLGAISLGTFQTAAILLGGLFFYDIFWVFGTDVMMTVATKVEAPVKFLYTAPPVPEGAAPRSYPFSVLGLGDVVIPGLFVRFMGKMDEVLQPTKISYFNAATAAYALGLGTCFVVNELTQAGQPALLYLDPACIGSALACGAVNGQLKEVWSFEENPSEEEDE